MGQQTSKERENFFIFPCAGFYIFELKRRNNNNNNNVVDEIKHVYTLVNQDNNSPKLCVRCVGKKGE